MSANLLSDLTTIIADLDALGLLIRIKSEVDPILDLAGTAARYEGGPRAVLFENVKGHDIPVLTGLYWSRGCSAHSCAATKRTYRSMSPAASKRGSNHR